jgi:hypothetical protein
MLGLILRNNGLGQRPSGLAVTSVEIMRAYLPANDDKIGGAKIAPSPFQPADNRAPNLPTYIFLPFLGFSRFWFL